MMVAQIRLKWFYWLSSLFILLSVIFLAREQYWFLLVPFALFVIYIAVTSMDKIIFFIVLTTPFAVNLDNNNFKLALSIPTEPLMFGLMIIFFLKVIYEGGFDRKI